MDTSSSSKVTVEYHDPSGVFQLISNDIASRLPLRNLNWQSPTRPLRQIKSLHLEFVPDNFTNNSLRPPAQRTDSDGATSFDIVRSGVDARKNVVKERRHQIPGLQTSPYLKLYILRADDKDTYKAVERKKIRDWIRDSAAKTKKGKGENHDAFEWLIVHVVIPDTTASSEPRWRESSRDSEELKERKKGMKLPGKSTRTVFDKLRADFNESGKSGQDRVAQIRLTRAQVSADILPTPAMATTIEETNEEREKAWDDLMGKFRPLILGPFDQRVRQYEADVAEQDSRRAMPGFNFCTFFIYKEGLAKAFESIGLVDDALVIYDELSLGFETVLKDMAKNASTGTATTFAPYTADIIDRVVGSNKAKPNGVSPEVHGDSGGGEAFQKDYREKIVRSDISVFDFSCYMFARQNALILRIANAKSSRFGVRSGIQETSEDLVLISEVCWRAASFVHNAARLLRRDLHAYTSAQWEKQVESPLSEADIESVVCSWTYIVAGQMLDETYSPALETLTEPGGREVMQNGSALGPKHAAVASLGGVNAYPQRTTSLPARKSRTSELQGRESLQSASESDLMSPPLSPGSDRPKATGPQPGLLELVTYRAELHMMQRKMLEQLAKQRNWVAGWALMEGRNHSKMEEIDLNDDTESTAKVQVTQPESKASALLSRVLDQALSSKDTFHANYERLSDRAMRLYVSATQSKRAESIMGDLAILKYQQDDYSYAASYFQHVLPFYAEEGWSLMEIEALRMHSMCLKELDRKEEYVTTLLALAAKACGWRKAQNTAILRAPTFDEMADVSGVLPEALAFSANLDVDVTSAADAYFEDIKLGREVMHGDDKDGFSLRLRLRHLLDDTVRFDRISARLVSMNDSAVEVWLGATDVKLQHGTNEINLETTSNAFGPFLVERIVLQTNRAIFLHELMPRAAEEDGLVANLNDAQTAESEPGKQPWIFVYPNEHAFSADMVLAKHVEIEKSRHLEIYLESGWNEVQAVELKLRPATAGLRLHVADAALNNIAAPPDEESRTGVLDLGGIPANTTAVVKIPYTLEQAGKEIFVRLEATYSTAKGSFCFLRSAKPPTQLPLDVDLNDLFKTDVLMSNFTVRTTGRVPVVVTEADFKPSPLYDVEGPPFLGMPMNVFQQLPVQLAWFVRRKLDVTGPISKQNAALMLSLGYCAAEGIIFHALEILFVKALQQSSFSAFTRLLAPFLVDRAKVLIPVSEIESSLLHHEVDLPSFGDIGWTEVIAGLADVVRDPLTAWLQKWHQDNTLLKVDTKAPSADLQCRMDIPLEIPSLDFVHWAALNIRTEDMTVSKHDKMLVLGQPVRASLSVTSTTDWNTEAVLDPTTVSGKNNGKDFVYDIQADPDTWLIGGHKRGRFHASNTSSHTFDVLLVPLKLGALRLPNVDLQPAHMEGPSEGEAGSNAAPPVSCETYYGSSELVFQIYRAMESSRVFIPEVPGAGPSSRPSTGTTAKDTG